MFAVKQNLKRVLKVNLSWYTSNFSVKIIFKKRFSRKQIYNKIHLKTSLEKWKQIKNLLIKNA